MAPIFLAADEYGLTDLYFLTIEEKPADNTPPAGQKFLEQAVIELTEYFEGKRKNFTVPLHITGGTPFQHRVWQALQAIPYGDTRSYQEIATSAQSPKAVRAVGQANSKNPIAIIIPCHRVIGKNGKLTGYMGANEIGLQLKQALLSLEKTNF